MGLPGPSSGWQSPRHLVPRSEQGHPSYSGYTLLQNLERHFFTDKGRSLGPRQIPRMLRREYRYRMSKPQQSEHMTTTDSETANMDKAVSSSLYFRSRNWNLPSSLDTHHAQNESGEGC